MTEPARVMTESPHAVPGEHPWPDRVRPVTGSPRIGGQVPLTTIDYPGELSTVVFCQGCPWRCRYCHNTGLLDPQAKTPLDWSEIRGFLERRRGLLDGVVFSGGEPTLQSGMADAMSEVRALGFKVGLHTAGTYPRRLAALLDRVDWVALDIKALPEDYPAITGVAGSGQSAWSSLEILLAAGLDYEVRTTVLPDWTPDQLARLVATLADAGVRHYALQACDIQHALDPSLASTGLSFDQLIAAIDPSPFTRFVLRGA